MSGCSDLSISWNSDKRAPHLVIFAAQTRRYGRGKTAVVEHAGSHRIADTLTWPSAMRSDLRVAEALPADAEPDGLYGISVARIVDHFLFFAEEPGVGEALRRLRPEGVQREVIPAELYVVLYFLRCLARIPSQESLPELWFSDTALMLRLGFNAHQIELGIPGAGLRAERDHGATRRWNPERVRPVRARRVARSRCGRRTA